MQCAHSFKGERFGPAQALHGITFVVDAVCKGSCLLPENYLVDICAAEAALHDALRANGIEVVAPALGDKFDVAAMEAVHVVPIEKGRPSGLVESILRPGYVLHGERVLRAAQVGVGAAQESNDSGSGGGGPDGDGGGSAGSTA